MKDTLKKFTRMQSSLVKECERLEAEVAEKQARIAAIRQVIGAHGPASRNGTYGTHRALNTMSLRAAVWKVTKDEALTKPEILKAIEALGYKFTARNPMNSLNVCLYTPGTVRNMGNGKWKAIPGSPAKTD